MNFEQLIASDRFKKATDNKVFTLDELQKINQLYKYIKSVNSWPNNYNLFCCLIKTPKFLIPRYKWLIKNSSRRTKMSYLIRHGTKEGLKRWDLYTKKQREKNLFESKNIKYGWSKKQFDEFNKSRAITLEKCIERHGEKEGVEIWENYCNRQRYTNTLEYFIEKYGEDGKEKWLTYNKQKASYNPENIMRSYGVDFDTAIEIITSRKSNIGYNSITEKEFVDEIQNRLSKPIKYTYKTKQFSIWNSFTNSINFYDVADTYQMKIIEFDGDYWHCNPKQYKPDFVHPHAKIKAKEIWKFDYSKTKIAIDRGFKLKRVWWSEFVDNREQLIEECIDWWNSK